MARSRRMSSSAQAFHGASDSKAQLVAAPRTSEDVGSDRLDGVVSGDAEPGLEPRSAGRPSAVAGVDPRVAEPTEVTEQPAVIATERQRGLVDPRAGDLVQARARFD